MKRSANFDEKAMKKKLSSQTKLGTPVSICYLGVFLGIIQSRVNDFHSACHTVYRIHLKCFYMPVSIISSYLMVYSEFQEFSVLAYC